MTFFLAYFSRKHSTVYLIPKHIINILHVKRKNRKLVNYVDGYQ